MKRNFAKRRRRFLRRAKEKKIFHKILQITLMIFGFILAIFLGIMAGRTFGGKVIVDGSSMQPTLRENEVMRIDRLIYKLRKPGRMDLIVFDMGKGDMDRYYVRRVIGLPEETVQIIDGVIYIDEEPIEYKYNSEYIENAGIAEDKIVLGMDEYFVLGDNFNDCEDSRYDSVGIINKDQIEGKAR